MNRKPSPPRGAPGPPLTAPLTWRQARAKGVSPRQIAKTRGQSPVPSVHLPQLTFLNGQSEPPPLSGRDFASILTDDVADLTLNRRSAAQYLELRLPSRLQETVPVTINRPGSATRLRRRGIECSSIDYPENHLWHREGLRITHPARTLLDLLPHLSDAEAIAVADGIVNCHPDSPFGPHDPQMSLTELLEFGEGLRRVRNCARFRRFVEHVRVGVDSIPETQLRLTLLAAGIRGLAVGQPVRSASGGVLFRPDLEIEELRLSIQFEGAAFHSSEERVARDIERARATRAAGWREIRIRHADLYRMTTFHGWRVSVAAAEVLRAIERLGALRTHWRPAHPELSITPRFWTVSGK